MHLPTQVFFRFDKLFLAAPLGNGNINDTYHIAFETAGKRHNALLQRLNHQVFRNPEMVMENTSRVCRHLATKADYPYQIVAPLPTLEGDMLHRDEAGNYWRAFPFVPDSFAPEGLSDPHIACEAARAYGAFARALCDFPAHTLVETIPGFHDTDRRWQAFLQILDENPACRAALCLPEIEAIFEAKTIFDNISRLKKSGELPLRVAHNDTKAGNVLFNRNTRRALAVIDLDTVMPGTLLSDFGDMVRTFVPDCGEDATQAPRLRIEVLNALTDAFLEETTSFLTETERENLLLGASWIVGEQALRFLADWLAGDVYYKTRSPQHNLERARNQLAVLNLLQEMQAETKVLTHT